MNNQTPTAQSGPSAQPKLTMKLAELPEWIERTIQTIEDPIFNYSPAEIANALRHMLKTLAETPQDNDTPPVGARDALIIHLRAAVSIGRPLLHSDVDEIEAALTGKADGNQFVDANKMVQTAATGMGDANLRALSNLAAPGLFEHDAEHASVIGGGAAPGCDGDKCVHHTIVIEDADLQFMVAAANHVRTALAAQPAPVVPERHIAVPVALPALAVSAIKDMLEEDYQLHDTKARPLWAKLLEIVTGLTFDQQVAINEEATKAPAQPAPVVGGV